MLLVDRVDNARVVGRVDLARVVGKVVESCTVGSLQCKSVSDQRASRRGLVSESNEISSRRREGK